MREFPYNSQATYEWTWMHEWIEIVVEDYTGGGGKWLWCIFKMRCMNDGKRRDHSNEWMCKHEFLLEWFQIGMQKYIVKTYSQNINTYFIFFDFQVFDF